MSSWRRSLPAAAGPLLGYVLVTTGLFAPSGSRLLREQIGGGDSLESLWNAWWVGQSLLQLENPWWTDWIFAPEGTTLVWHSLVPLTSAVVAVLSYGLPAQLAYNLVVLAALPSAGMCAWALCRHLTGDATASFVGGLAFMLCPFIASKTLGHLDLLYGGLLPLFYLALLRALCCEPPAARAAAWRLAAISLVLLFACSPNIPVFAANLSFFLLCRQIRIDGLPKALPRFGRIFAPTLLLALPYLLLAVGSSIAYEQPPRSHSDLDYDPELVSYLLPLTTTSVYSDLAKQLPFGGDALGLDGVEPAVYLGLIVLPVALAGLWQRRRDPLIAHLAFVGAIFLALSMGPKLQWQREVVEVGGMTAYLPFGLWRWVPVLGSVGQAARYALIVYLVMAVGVACAVSALRARIARPGGFTAAIATTIVALLVCIDFAFSPITSALPRTLDLQEPTAARQRVLDPRVWSAETMYQQTRHARPLIGGYISRAPLATMARYERDVVLGWLFRREPGPPPTRDEVVTRLEALRVGDVLLSPGDPRGDVLAGYGFRERDSNGYTTVWTR